MPRAPIELTDHQRIEVETLAALLNQEQIADYLGIGRTTFHEIMKRDPEVAERYKRGKAKAIAHVANGLLQKARAGCTTSSIFYLKTQAGWRETERLEHAVAGETDGAGAREALLAFLDERSTRQAALRAQELSDTALEAIAPGERDRRGHVPVTIEGETVRDEERRR